MSTVEDFRGAPVGATATHADGSRAVKIDDGEQSWMLRTGAYVQDELVEQRGYTLDPPTPTTAREALYLAWELAHEVKPGQVIPKGTRCLEFSITGLKEYAAYRDFGADLELASIVRTLEPLPEPEPDWLDAPAAYARCGYCSHEDYGLQITLHGPVLNGQKWECAECQTATDWSNLRDVTPLYPKEEQNS